MAIRRAIFAHKLLPGSKCTAWACPISKRAFASTFDSSSSSDAEDHSRVSSSSSDEAGSKWLYDLESKDEWNESQLTFRTMPAWMEAERLASAREATEVSQSLEEDDSTSSALLHAPMRDELGRAYSTGRRKTASARVWVKEGDGEFTVNGQSLANCGGFDVTVTVKGGGLSGQAGAVKHGLARAIGRYDPFLKPVLKSYKMLLRDPRMVERKKPGQKKARKKFQWVKR